MSEATELSEVPGKKGGKHFPPQTTRLLSQDDLRPKTLYAKRTNNGASTGSGNGSVGGAGGRIRQNSKVNLLANQVMSLSSGTGGTAGQSLSQSNGATRPSSTVTVTDPEKILAAKKRREDTVTGSTLKANGRRRRSCKQRIKVMATVSVSLMLILSGASLLFTCLIVVDPIVVGLRAQFNEEPGICRTVFYRNVTGPMNCMMPSCREGCTADLYICTFIFVVYYEYSGLNVSIVEDDGVQSIAWDEDSLPEPVLQELTADLISGENSTFTYHNATLMINPNGCGYPPEVNCSVFEERFLRSGTLFPCFYSETFLNDANSRVAVPFYSRDVEMTNLGLSLGIPLGSVLVLSFFLFILVRWNVGVKRNIVVDLREDVSMSAFSSFSKSAQFRDSFGQETRTLSYSRPESTRTSSGKTGNKLNGHGPKKRVLEPIKSLPNGSVLGNLVDNLVKGKTPMLGQLAKTHFSNGVSSSVQQDDDWDDGVESELLSLPSSSTSRPLPINRNLVSQTSLR